MRIAALDLGSNSFHLIVVDVHFDGTFSPIIREKEMLLLGDLVARNGEIGEEGMDRAIEVLLRFNRIASAHKEDDEHLRARKAGGSHRTGDPMFLSSKVRC